MQCNTPSLFLNLSSHELTKFNRKPWLHFGYVNYALVNCAWETLGIIFSDTCFSYPRRERERGKKRDRQMERKMYVLGRVIDSRLCKLDQHKMETQSTSIRILTMLATLRIICLYPREANCKKMQTQLLCIAAKLQLVANSTLLYCL